MDTILLIVGILCGLYGLFILFASLVKKFQHIGMTLAGICFLVGGLLCFYLNSWWPIVGAVVLTIIIRRAFGEPDYSKGNIYHKWAARYRPLMGNGEPLNYIEVLKNITDMNEEEKKAYIDQKITNSLLWTVLDLGNDVIEVRPGRHDGDVIAWWVCDVPYSKSAQTFNLTGI